MTEERQKTQAEIDFFEEYGVWPISNEEVANEEDRIILSTEQVAETEVHIRKKNAKYYLAETDWYVTRKAETGTAIPDDVLTKRAQARIDASD